MPCTGTNTETGSCQSKVTISEKIVFFIVQTFSFQLRGLGNYGAHGELALVHVTTQQPGVEQEASMVARCHAQAVGQMWAVAQVRHIL